MHGFGQVAKRVTAMAHASKGATLADETRSGHYPIERRAGEIERLRIQGEAMSADATIGGSRTISVDKRK